MPCTDGLDAIGNGGMKKEVSKSSSHNKETQQKDNCSPFCSCSCCHGFPITQPIVKDFLSVTYIEKCYNSFYPSGIKGISLPIWQPPQLS